MQTRIALIGIMVEDMQSVDKINAILHDYAQFIVGRMGIPYRDRGINIISIIIDASNEVISGMSGKLGMVSGVNVKAMYAKNE